MMSDAPSESSRTHIESPGGEGAKTSSTRRSWVQELAAKYLDKYVDNPKSGPKRAFYGHSRRMAGRSQSPPKEDESTEEYV